MTDVTKVTYVRFKNQFPRIVAFLNYKTPHQTQISIVRLDEKMANAPQQDPAFQALYTGFTVAVAKQLDANKLFPTAFIEPEIDTSIVLHGVFTVFIYFPEQSESTQKV